MSPGDDYSSLGRVLVALGACTQKNVLEAIVRYPRLLLGEALIKLGHCTPNEVANALKFQDDLRSTGISPGKAALDIVKSSAERYTKDIQKEAIFCDALLADKKVS